jgi:heme exporter protein CcmD
MSIISDPNFGFILVSYLTAAAVFIGLLIWMVLDYRHQKKTLTRLETTGVRRRSAENDHDD